MTRKIIQVATLSPALSESTFFGTRRMRTLDGTILALCDDSSVWSLDVDSDTGGTTFKPQWTRLPEIPQD